MKKTFFFFLILFLPCGKELQAQQFRRIITSFAVRLPQIYPPSLPLPDPQNLASLKPTDRPRYDSVLGVYQARINELENQPPTVQRDTILMGYLHDQIVLRSFLDIWSFDPENPVQPDTSRVIPLARQLRKLAVTTNHSYYIWAGYIWEEVSWLNSRNIINSFEVSFDRAKLCDDCPVCGQAPECYIAMAQYYAEFNDTINTDLYFEKAFNSTAKIQEKVFTLREQAAVYNKQYKPGKALQAIDALYKLEKNPFDETWILEQKAIAQVQLGQFDAALSVIQNAQKRIETNLKNQGDFSAQMIKDYVTDHYRAILAKIYLGKNEPLKAFEYANSPNFWDDLEGSPDKTLYLIHKALGDHKKALQYYEQYISFKDNQESDNRKNILSIMQRNYEVQKVQTVADAEKMRAENLIKARTYLLIGLLLLVVILFLLWRSNRRKQRTNELLNRQKQEIDFQRNTAEQALIKLQSTQAQLIQSEKLASLGEVTAGIAHEIQNPLNFVNNFSELSVDLAKEINEELDKENLDMEFVKELMGDLAQNQEKINHHGKRAAGIVSGMLQHARASPGKKEPTDLNALADEYLRLSYHGLRAKDPNFNAAMITGFDPAIGKVQVIPQDLGRVLLNLINNAFYAVQQRKRELSENFKFSESSYEPTVTVSTQKTDNQIIIKVKDNGTGIPEAVKAKIFQPFFTTKPTGQGTGLGLSLAYDIVVKGHGGSLEVETRETEGSEFIIRLPGD